jgi:hypothetical protein
MLKNLTFLTLFLAFFSSCKTPQLPMTLAELNVVSKIYIMDKEAMPNRPFYTLSLYSDQRLELQSVGRIDKLGSFSTALSNKEYANLVGLMKKQNIGLHNFNHPKENVGYSISYFPLKTDISMANSKLITDASYVSEFMALIDNLVANKNWFKKEDAPMVFGEKLANQYLVSVKRDGKIEDVIKSMAADYGAKAVKCTDKTYNTWLVATDKGDKNLTILEFRKNPNVMGVIENSLINKEKNIKIFNNQELIVNFNQAVKIEDWVKTYEKYKMVSERQVAPDMNFYVVSFDATMIGAQEIMALIKKDSKVAEVQTNKKVLPRE